MRTGYMKRAVLLAGIFAGLVGTAHAQPGPGGFHHGDPMLDGVTLTDTQQTQLHALMKAGHADDKALFEQMRAIHDKIDATLLGTASVTAADLTPLVQQQEAVMQQLDAKRITQQIAVRNLLTADQISQASATHTKMAALHAQEQALHAGNDMPPPPLD